MEHRRRDRAFRIFGLCVIKNEADIIEQTLRAASAWCDTAYVLDNGSTDGSWEIVQDLARELPCVVPFRQDPSGFTDDIRNTIFGAVRSSAGRRDWWAILDADEMYVDDPRAFLARVPRRFDRVWHQQYNYLFTDADLAAYEADRSRFAAGAPIEARARYFVLGDHSELRFFRHSRLLTHIPGPGSGRVFPTPIRVRHYMYRSPEQIQQRLDTRREPMERGEFLHELPAAWTSGGGALAHGAELPLSWKERVVPTSECHLDVGDDSLPPSPWTPPRPKSSLARLRERCTSLARKAAGPRRAA